ncbi:hypothetical protein ACSNOH_06120 [Streptomyces sp. URMC 127]|uniref:hypothetical protein n=1 Tax=Streptomyces sp. URMC 127 TaxID=3423402 RepID=UPI003F19E309
MTAVLRLRVAGIATALAAALSTTLITATTAHAGVGTVNIEYFNSSNTSTGGDVDVFANLLAPQCDNNSVPSGTATARITNHTDQTITTGRGSCGSVSGEQLVPPGQSITMLIQAVPVTTIHVTEPAGL